MQPYPTAIIGQKRHGEDIFQWDLFLDGSNLMGKMKSCICYIAPLENKYNMEQ